MIADAPFELSPPQHKYPFELAFDAMKHQPPLNSNFSSFNSSSPMIHFGDSLNIYHSKTKFFVMHNISAIPSRYQIKMKKYSTLYANLEQLDRNFDIFS